MNSSLHSSSGVPSCHGLQLPGWVQGQFGDRQAIVYGETLSMALAALTEGSGDIGPKARDEILKGLCTLHVARNDRKGRHFIIFRLAPRGSGRVIEVLRILHDSMNLARHLEAREK